MHHLNFNSDTQNKQITLSSSEEEKEIFWQEFKLELVRFKELVESPRFQEDKVIHNIIKKKKFSGSNSKNK